MNSPAAHASDTVISSPGGAGHRGQPPSHPRRQPDQLPGGCGRRWRARGVPARSSRPVAGPPVPGDPAHQVAQLLQPLLPQLLVPQVRWPGVLAAAVGFDHCRPLRPEEVDARPPAVPLVHHEPLRHGRWESVPGEQVTTQRFQRGFGATVRLPDDPGGAPDPGPGRAAEQCAVEVTGLSQLEVQGGVRDNQSVLVREAPGEIDHGASRRGDPEAADRTDVPVGQSGNVDPQPRQLASRAGRPGHADGHRLGEQRQAEQPRSGLVADNRVTAEGAHRRGGLGHDPVSRAGGVNPSAQRRPRAVSKAAVDLGRSEPGGDRIPAGDDPVHATTMMVWTVAPPPLSTVGGLPPGSRSPLRARSRGRHPPAGVSHEDTRKRDHPRRTSSTRAWRQGARRPGVGQVSNL